MQKIFNQIDKLAVKGKEQIYEYHKLIDDLISKGDYNYLELVLFYMYDIDIKDKNLLYVKNKTLDKILFQTNSSLLKKVKKVFDTNGVYQMGFDIYRETDNENIGSILEIDILSDESKYYLQNRQFARIIGTRLTYLEVKKFGATSSIIVDTQNRDSSEENNLVSRYKTAINYLLS